LACGTAAGAQDSGRSLRGRPVRSYRLGDRAACRRLPEGVCEKPQRRIGRRADRRNGFRSRVGAVDEKSPSLSNEEPCLLLILGCLSETAPSESANEIELASCCRLVLYTDGLVQVFNTEGKCSASKVFSTSTRCCKSDIAGNEASRHRRRGRLRHGPLAADVSLVIVEIR